MQLRDYQERLIADTIAALRAGHRSVVLVSATGSGKTCVAARILSGAAAKGKRAWFICHRQEILSQSVETIEESSGLGCGVIAAGYGPNGYAPIQVCTVQTLIRRWQKYPTPDVIVWDEVHHLPSASWSKLKDCFPNAVHIGITATAQRLDGRGLGSHFTALVQGPSTARLISEKYLSPYAVFAPSMPDLKAVHTVAGDWNKSELDVAMRGSKVTGDAIAEYKARCMGKRALMFLWSVKSSQEMAEAFNAQGVPAAHLDGTTNDETRKRNVAAFREGRIKVLTNVEIVTEGFDLPAIEACFLLRPTQSLGLYLQMVGRALRPFPGKERALIMDHSGLVFQHGLPDMEREWSLEGTAGGSKKKQEVPIRQCMQCYAVMPSRARKCYECGYEFPIMGREVSQESGELQEIDMEAMARLFKSKQRAEVARSRDYEDLVKIERERGYKPGWARHIAQARENKLHSIANQFRPSEEK